MLILGSQLIFLATVQVRCYTGFIMNKSPINELNRLALLSGTDAGFFILAIHSFILGLSNSNGWNMLVYLDNCVFNRPFGDQDQLLISLLTQANFITSDRRILKERAFGPLRIVEPVVFLLEAEEIQHGL